MTSSCPKAAHPLNRKAVAEADNALYAAHASDPRPNALYDAAGRKLLLSPTDPAQECLRDEWTRYYSKAGGRLAPPKPAIGSPPGSAKLDCPCSKAKLTVKVVYDPLQAPVKDAEVTIKGTVTKTVKTDATGIVKFVDLPPGTYMVSGHYGGKHKLVDAVVPQVGSTNWDTDKARPPLPVGSNKCNLFVYESVTGAGYAVPQKPHERKLLGFTVSTIMLPPNAVDWASPTSTLITYPTTTQPQPGDIIAWSHTYANATGHVGIVSYPEDAPSQTKTLAAGDDADVTLKMRRRTISAAHHQIEESTYYFWHYYHEGKTNETNLILFRRLDP